MDSTLDMRNTDEKDVVHEPAHVFCMLYTASTRPGKIMVYVTISKSHAERVQASEMPSLAAHF
jgi:hypothetical protein